MKYSKFVTEIFKGKSTISPDILEKYKTWSRFEKELDPIGRSDSTTVHGWQYSFSNNDAPPDWFDKLLPLIKEIKEEIGYNVVKSMWTVYYNKGGFQDPHFHQPGNNLYTVIINISGDGELVIFDPRQLATAHGASIVEIEKLSSGDWIAMPSWLVHSTRPCADERIILVLDVYQ